MNLSLDELRLIAQARNISDYENKSKEALIKVLSETKPKPKKEIKPKPEPRIEIKPKPEPEPEPKIEVKLNRKKLEKLRKDFDELRHKFSKTETNEYCKSFYGTKKYKNLSISEKLNKSLNEDNIDSVGYEDLDN